MQRLKKTRIVNGPLAWCHFMQILDVEDDGHLYEWLDPQQWQGVFAALEAMPPDSRSLRAAILATYPEVLPPTPADQSR
jgi:hypothetical protein